jgi:hypothetical protein
MLITKMNHLCPTASETTLLITLVMEAWLEPDNGTIGIKTKELVTLEIERVIQNLHLDCTRSIAIAHTTCDLV